MYLLTCMLYYCVLSTCMLYYCVLAAVLATATAVNDLYHKNMVGFIITGLALNTYIVYIYFQTSTYCVSHIF